MIIYDYRYKFLKILMAISYINWAFKNNQWHRLPTEKFITNVQTVSQFNRYARYIVFRARE